jgi:predicted nucleic acid-binding Zn ribbon protein
MDNHETHYPLSATSLATDAHKTNGTFTVKHCEVCGKPILIGPGGHRKTRRICSQACHMRKYMTNLAKRVDLPPSYRMVAQKTAPKATQKSTTPPATVIGFYQNIVSIQTTKE